MKILQIIMIIFLALSIVALAKDQIPSENQTVDRIVDEVRDDIRQRQRQQKEQINLEKMAYKTYNFKIQGASEFIIRPVTGQQIFATVDVYWNQNNVYMVANIDMKEYLEIKVLKGDKSVILNQMFYSATGFKFNATAGQQYRIRFSQKGKIVKLLTFHLSEQITPSNTTAKKGTMMKTQSKIILAENKLNNGLQAAKLGVLMNSKIDEQVLRKTTLYSWFQTFEILFIVAGSWIQVHLVFRLLKTDSII